MLPWMPGCWSSQMKSHAVTLTATAVVLVAALAGCTAVTSADTSTDTGVSASEVAAVQATGDLWDSSVVHDISIDVSDEALTEALEAYASTGEKIWIEATVTIDGTTFEAVGLKLKGNSSLRGITVDSAAEELPWIIRLDKFVDDQNYDGWTQLVIRGNNSETSLNEAVALELLEEAGLASEQAISAVVTVNGASDLRLVIQNPDDEWADSEFGTDGALYKAESGGDYSYRGEDAEAYTDVFEQEAGDDDLAPLTAFLQFINESSDETFAAELDQWLDVDAFATYLAFQELVDNFDDIDGPGNNSYLWYDSSTGLMTVVSWDLNLALGVSNGAGGGGGMGGDRPAGGGLQGGPDAGGAQGMGGMGGPSQGNILSERFLNNAEFASLYESTLASLRETLYTSGAASEILQQWVDALGTQDLVSASTVADEAAAVAEYFE